MPYRKYKKKGCKTPMFGKADKYVAKQAFNMAKKALMSLNVEYKCHDVNDNLVSVNQTPTIIQLTNIPQGSTAITRDGNQIKITANYLRFNIIGGSSANSLFRLMLVQDKQTNQAVYTIGDLLATGDANSNITSPLNIDNKYRFTVLYDKVFRTSNVSNNALYKDIYKKMQLRIRYDASTPDITDLTSSSLSLVFISNLASGNPSITYYNRIRFVDN